MAAVLWPAAGGTEEEEEEEEKKKEEEEDEEYSDEYLKRMVIFCNQFDYLLMKKAELVAWG